MKPERWCRQLPTGEYIETRGVVATSIALAALAAGASAGGGIVAGKLASNASRDAANIQAKTATQSGELQAQAAREALAFQKAEAAQEQQNFTNTQLANYGQYADRQNRIGSLGSLLGLPNRVAPPPPDYLTGRQTVSGQGQTVAGVDPKIQSFIADYQAKNPDKPGIEGIAAAVAKQFPGVGRFDYGGGNLSNNELNIPGYGKYKVIGGENTPGAYWYVPGTDDSAPGAASGPRSAPVVPMSALFAPAATQQPSNLTPALMMPRVNPFGV